MTDVIARFAGRYEFLSNFYPARVHYDGAFYPTVEHAYQAAKTKDNTEREAIRCCPTPGAAKRLGRAATLRSNWDQIKLHVMTVLVWRKFSHHPELAQMLLDTGDLPLVEGNHWGDTFWGQCPFGTGENHLGRILVDTRWQLSIAPHADLPKRSSL